MAEPTEVQFSKAITPDEHASHARSHLGRSKMQLGNAKDHLVGIGKCAGAAMGKLAAAGDVEKGMGRKLVHHLAKSAEYAGRASEQQSMAAKHMAALNGDPAQGEKYAKAESNCRDMGNHLTMMVDHLGELGASMMADSGESSDETKARGDQMVEHLQKSLDSYNGALSSGEAAQSSIDESLHPVAADDDIDPDTTKGIVVMDSNGYLFVKRDDKGALPLTDVEVEIFVPVEKIERVYEKDGKTLKGLMVYGWGSVPEYLDSQNDIVDQAGLTKAVNGTDTEKGWRDWGNIRLMHEPDAVGTANAAGCELEMREHPTIKGPDGKLVKALWIGALIVADHAIRLCETRVIKGFSIGGKAKRVVPEEIEVEQEAA